MSAVVRRVSRVRPRLSLALVFIAALSAFALAARSDHSRRAPAAVRVPGARPARITRVGGVTLVASPSAPERIIPDTTAPDVTTRVRLLWLGGRPTGVATHGSVTLDAAGGVVLFDEHLRPHRRAIATGGRLITDVAEAASGGLWLADDAGHVIRTNAHGDVTREVVAPFHYPALATAGSVDGVWLVRSPARFGYAWDSTGNPLFARLTGAGTIDRRVGRAALPAHVMLQDLANAGRLTVANGTIYFAPFIRDQIVALDTLGDTLWVASRDLPQTTREPRFEVDGGHVVIDYHPVNLGITLGPDGRLYVLSTPGPTTLRSRLDAFDPATGRLLRSVDLSTALPTIAADADGRVYSLDETRLLTGVAPREREAFTSIDLPMRRGGRITSAAVRDRVTLVNFWASWCTVCRVEMPALDSIRRGFSDSGMVFVSINADQAPASADRFLRHLSLQFDYALGGPSISAAYHVPGLPFTVLLDREGRVVQRWAGFTGPEQSETIRAAVRLELDRSRRVEHHTHHGDHD